MLEWILNWPLQLIQCVCWSQFGDYGSLLSANQLVKCEKKQNIFTYFFTKHLQMD